MGRSSFAKRDREQTKRAKAEAKRQRRQAGPGDGEMDGAEGVAAVEEDQTPTEELLQMIEDLHREHAEGRVSDDDFETTKADLLGRLRVD